MADPQVGQRVQLKLPVGNLFDPGRLEVGTSGTVDEIVPAEVDGAGDHERDCVVVLLDNGRRWSHPIEGELLENVAPEHIAADPHADEHQADLQGGMVARLAWDEVMEVVE